MARLTPLPVTISLTLLTSVAAHPEPIGTRTCARWLDGREQHLSTTMETWVEGYLASSNQWTLALGLGEAPLLVPELLKLIDESCKSKPDARLANVVLDVIRTELSRRKTGQKPRRGDGPQVTVSASARRLELSSFTRASESRDPQRDRSSDTDCGLTAKPSISTPSC